MGTIWGLMGRGPDLLIVLYFAVWFLGARFLLDRLLYKEAIYDAYLYESRLSVLPSQARSLRQRKHDISRSRRKEGRLAPLAVRLLRAVPINDEARCSKIAKCSESMWKLTYYAGVQLWVLLIIKLEPWSLDTKQYFKGWPNQELKPSVMLFYMCQCGFYIYSIGALIAWETRRKDFFIMMSHHIITSILIGYSYLTRFFRIGTIILALHDTCDVFLEAAKVFKYSEKETAASVVFGFFAASWLLLRLIYFPFWIIKTSSYYSIESLMSSNGFPTTLYYVFNTMLLTLLVFHLYWGKLICAMIMRQMSNRGQVGEDIRSDSEDGD